MKIKASCAAWLEGRDYKLLSVREGGGKWRMETLRPQTLYFENELIGPATCRNFHAGRFTGFGETPIQQEPWLTVYPRKMVLRQGYRWNGNSPKKGIRFLWRDWWFGTPDFQPGTVACSAFHDAFFQFSGLAEMPLTLNEANTVYHQLAESHGAPMDEIYNLVLKVCSSRVWGKAEPGAFCIVANI